MAKSFSYKEYKSFFEDLVNQGTTTGENPDKSLINYTKLNWSRAKRVEKTFKPLSETVSFLENVETPIKLVIITEPWCGDAAQVVPAIASVAELSEKIKVEVVLRDENEELMNRYLTNGGKAIPIFVIVDRKSGKELGHWGPRPLEAQAMVLKYKETPEEEKPSYHDFVQEMQQWYNHDKTASIQKEFLSKCKEVLA